MAQNDSPSLLDSAQIIKRLYNQSNDSVRVEVASGTDFEVSLSATDGDSVVIYGNGFSGSTAALTSASSGTVLAATSCVGIKSFQLYGIVTAVDAVTTAGNIVVRIEVSPDDSANVWHNTGSTTTVSAGSAVGVIAVNSILSTLIARRVRLVVSSNALAGNDAVQFYLVGNSV